eukprot:UN21406
MHVSKRKVWDYAYDEFVDRLIENKTDGKLISKGRRLNIEDQLSNSVKLQDLAQEYQYLLTNQTKQQRKIYQRKLKNQP